MKILDSGYVGEDLFDTFKIDFIKGRGFKKSSTNDLLNVVINQSASKLLGFGDNPLGKQFYRDSPKNENRRLVTVIGLVKDFHSNSLIQPINPLILSMISRDNQKSVMAVKTNNTNFTDINSEIETIYNSVFPGEFMASYGFRESLVDKAYRKEERLSSLINMFGLITILISCAGLFGLVSFTAEQKMKELGVRRVLGASTMQLVWVFVKEFRNLIFIANIIAMPIAYYFMTQWLNNFAFRVELNAIPFISAILFSIILAGITVAYQTFKSSNNYTFT